MVTLDLPDLPDADLDEPAREWLPDAEGIVDRCVAAVEAGEPAGLVDLLGELGAPVLDSTVTPLSARAALLGAQDGRAFYHHELRRRVPMPEELEPELSVWDGGTTPTWQDGVLEEPKYFSFFQDAPFPAFNPNYRRKWRPHELIHGSLGFFWHPEMTRFEFYVGARLNELLPVVHWYGLDEIFRPRCERHEGTVLYSEYCGECEALARHYWNEAAPEQHRDAALHWAREALEHFETEWGACQREIETGQRHPTPRLKLDASSDSVGYLRSHWNRVTDWSFGAWLETFLEDGVDYHSSLVRYAENLAETTRAMLGGTISVEPETFRTRRNRRAVQDAAYQIYLAMGWLDPGSPDLTAVEERLMPHIEQAAHHVHHIDAQEQLADFTDEVLFDMLEAFGEVADHFPDEVAAAVPALGYTFESPQFFVERAIPQLEAGLQSGLPQTVSELDDVAEAARGFAGSDEFRALGRYATRFAGWSNADNLGAAPADVADFEAWAMDLPRKDEEAELFGALPANIDEFIARPAHLRLNETLRRGSFAWRAAAKIIDPSVLPEGATVDLARIFMRGELRIIVDDPASSAILDAVDARQPPQEWVEDSDLETLGGLLQNGFIVWLPKPA
jgi:hypothetical protein